MVYSEATKILARPLLFTAGIIGSIEALPWTVLSIIAICYYNNAITYEVDISDLSSYSLWIYQLFLNPSSVSIIDGIVTSKAFNIFMYFYMILSFLWLVISLFITWGMIRNKWSDIYNLTLTWIFLTVSTSILDIILMSLVARDLSTFNSWTSAPTIEPSTEDSMLSTTEDPAAQLQVLPVDVLSSHLRIIISTSYGIVMTIAARGYLLWISNVILAITLIVIAAKMHKENRPSLLPYIDAYETGPRPPFEVNGNVNGGYQDDNNAIFSRGQSLAFPYNKNPSGRLSNNPLANNIPLSHNNVSTLPIRPSVESNISFSKPIDRADRIDPPKLAKIGKTAAGRKSPSQNIPPPNVPLKNVPYIPEPDYSPPGTPRIPKPTKSVLRPKSNYVL